MVAELDLQMQHLELVDQAEAALVEQVIQEQVQQEQLEQQTLVVVEVEVERQELALEQVVQE